jgi:hypothetical protein
MDRLVSSRVRLQARTSFSQGLSIVGNADTDMEMDLELVRCVQPYDVDEEFQPGALSRFHGTELKCGVVGLDGDGYIDTRIALPRG